MLSRWMTVMLLFVVAVLLSVRLVYVESASFPDRSAAPLLPSTELEKMVSLPLPPGNLAVADDQRIFFTFHPEASPDINVAVWANDEVRAFPAPEWQPGGSAEHALNEVLSLRLHNNELWLLDNGRHALNSVRLLAFDINSRELLHSYRFPRDVFPLGAHANDFRISADGRYFFITDASLLARTPALVVYDRAEGISRRVLHNDASVRAGAFEPVVQGQAMTLFGLFTVNPGVDGIALDDAGEWLYFAAVAADQVYRIRVADLLNADLPYATLSARVEALGPKTMTDGMALDAAGNLYFSDLEHSAIVRRTPAGELQTLLRSVDLRWPDGFSRQGDYLYLTCSALHQVIGHSREDILAAGPYPIYRFSLSKAESYLNP
ncbi:SMP-30/gluconolactonase/LRE family protein [Thalassolituus pacificus]|uniref:Major royal jelly family protein n=1 Tax=Thalassolituus pacificus TaxID=2975440 RepID=A0A9X3ADH2_9GAMM|nr:major royal jelly family protein [Thalassolituus pacificus]MCT7357587.1 major royal jelly family protein [Thalassolituus pacificus]